MKYSEEIAKAIRNHLEDAGMHLVAFEEDEDAVTFGFDMGILGQLSFVKYIIIVHSDEYTVMAFCPIRANNNDQTVMNSMAEFITRANYGLKSGNFEMDFEDGELRFKCYVNCEDQIPTDGVIRNSIGVPQAMMMRYSRGIIGILFQQMNAKDAVEMCESESRDELGSMLHDLIERVGKTILDGDNDTSADLPKGPLENSKEEEIDSLQDARIPSYADFLSIMDVANNEATGDEAIEDELKDDSAATA